MTNNHTPPPQYQHPRPHPRVLVLEILNSTDLTRPDEIAELVLKDMSPEAYEYTLKILMPGFVSDVMRAHRRPRMTDAGLPSRQSRTAPLRPARTHADRMRVGWRSELFARFYDPTARGGKGDWFLLGDLTTAQHRAIREDRLAQASRLDAWARWHATAVLTLEVAGVERTADLEPQDLADLLALRPTSAPTVAAGGES